MIGERVRAPGQILQRERGNVRARPRDEPSLGARAIAGREHAQRDEQRGENGTAPALAEGDGLAGARSAGGLGGR